MPSTQLAALSTNEIPQCAAVGPLGSPRKGGAALKHGLHGQGGLGLKKGVHNFVQCVILHNVPFCMICLITRSYPTSYLISEPYKMQKLFQKSDAPRDIISLDQDDISY
jgi:hypothetical protein